MSITSEERAKRVGVAAAQAAGGFTAGLTAFATDWNIGWDLMAGIAMWLAVLMVAAWTDTRCEKEERP